MAKTFLQLKDEIRAIIFPSGESSNLVAAHDKAFVDAIIDLQTWVECLQVDNVSIFPQCSTLYNCGITVFDAPRGRIKKVSVIDSTPAPAPSGDVVLTGTFNPLITDLPSAPTSVGTISAPDLYVIETLGNGSACKEKGVPQYFRVLVNYKKQDGTAGTLEKRVTLNDCDTRQVDQLNLAANSVVYVSTVPVNVPVKNELGTGGAQITVNVRKYVATDVLATTPDWCSEIEYRQIEPNYVQKYWIHARQHRRCPSIPFFFGLSPELTGLGHLPAVPTDADVPAGLAILPLGFHYPQTDTDKKHRARVGLWALERQKIYIAPWINSTETVLVKWDGIKRTWADADPVDDDPLLTEAITAFVRQNHFKYWDRDYQSAEGAQIDYLEARSKLIHECREETRIRGNEPSFARQASVNQNSLTLFYNTAQTATASCSSGQTGSPVVVTIGAGTVASSISQADADSQALSQAQQQAQARLDCQQPQTTYFNTPQSFTATCEGGSGTPVTINIPAGQFTSTISQADADAQALAAATAQANLQLSCTYSNTAQTFTAICSESASAVPVMQSNTAPSGVVSASSTWSAGHEFEGFLPATLFGGGWYAISALPQWLRYEFTTAQFITSYSLTRAPTGGMINGDPAQGLSPSPKDWQLQGSNNGTDWTVLDTQSGVQFGDANAKTFSVANPGSYLYYRILISVAYFPPAGLTGNITTCLANLKLFVSGFSTETTAAGLFTSTISQADADAQALNAAQVAANAALDCSSGGGPPSPAIYYNAGQSANKTAHCAGLGVFAGCTLSVTLIITDGTFSSIISQADANQQALNFANTRIQGLWAQACAYAQGVGQSCAPVIVHYP